MRQRLLLATVAWLAGFAHATAAAPALGPAFLPSPPKPGSAAQILDGETYLRTRAIRQRDPAHWAELRREALMGPQAMLQGFGCALGQTLDEQSQPALFRLWRSAAPAIERDIARAKAADHRPRPLLHNHQPICVSRFTRLDRSPSFPSRGAALGWALALILVEAAPEHAGTVLSHGTEIGNSRVECGVNWLSDVAAGQLEAGALVAMLHAGAGFRADLALVRQELAVTLSRPETGAMPPPGCRSSARRR